MIRCSAVLYYVLQVCRLPVAALGLLQHSQCVLADDAVYAEEKLIVVLPNHLSLLHRIACEQPGMIPKVRSSHMSVRAWFSWWGYRWCQHGV